MDTFETLSRTPALLAQVAARVPDVLVRVRSGPFALVEHLWHLADLEREGFGVECVRTGAAAIQLLKVVAYDLLILDLILPMVSGEEVMTFLEATQPSSLRRVIVMTASPRQLSCEFLQRICKILAKPFDIDELVLMARQCVKDTDSCATDS